MKEHEGFLARWSRRKLVKAAEPETPVAPPESAEAVAEAPTEAEFDLSILPDIETLTGKSDLSVFLQKGVPDALRNAAMRRVWALDTEIAAIKGPVDYAWDFNDPDAMIGFGPMAASFDPASMLDQVMGGAAPSQSDQEIPLSSAAINMESDRPDGSPPFVSADELPSAESANCEPYAEADQLAPEIEEIRDVPPSRKHGGALPEM